MDKPEVSLAELLQIIGDQQVQIALLTTKCRALEAALAAATPPGSVGH